MYSNESLKYTVIEEKKEHKMRLSRRYGLTSNPHKKVTSFAVLLPCEQRPFDLCSQSTVLYIDSIILRNGSKNILTNLLKNK